MHSTDERLPKRTKFHHESVAIEAISNQGRGLVNTSGKVLATGTCLLSVPLEQCWSLQYAAADKQFTSTLGSELPNSLDQESILALHLLYVKMHQENYPDRSAHLEQLPQSYNSSPFFSFDLLSANATFHQLTSQLLSQIAKDYANIIVKITGWSFNLEQWKWAVATVQSRCMDFISDGNSVRLLVPIADMINHALSPNAIHRLNLETNCVEIMSTRDIADKDQIYISYGPCSNSRLLQIYGFISENNPYDAFDLFLQTHTSAPFFSQKDNIMRKAGFDINKTIIPILYNDPATSISKILQYLRIQRCDSEELLKKAEETLAVDLVDVELEREIVGALVEALKGLFDSINVDQERPADASEMWKMQNEVAMIEKKILGVAIVELGKTLS